MVVSCSGICPDHVHLFWEIAKNTVFHKLLNISKEQVHGNFVKSTMDRVKIKLYGDLSGAMVLYESVGRVTSESCKNINNDNRGNIGQTQISSS